MRSPLNYRQRIWYYQFRLWWNIRASRRYLKWFWLWMLELPWQVQEDERLRRNPWFHWLVGWTWALAGLVGGALVASSLVQSVGLAGTSYEDWLVIAVAVLAGFLVQFLGWCLFLLIMFLMSPVTVYIANRIGEPSNFWSIVRVARVMNWITSPFVIITPLAGVGYGLYRYFTWVGAGQSSVTIAFVGGLLIKTFAIPLIKGIVTGALFKWFMKWLRDGKDT